MKYFSIISPLESEYFTTVRLTTGGVCALADFDVESTEDFKVCVTESLLILKRNGYQSARIEFSFEEKLSCRVVGKQKTGAAEENVEDEISFALLNALLQSVVFEKDAEGKVSAIAFEN